MGKIANKKAKLGYVYLIEGIIAGVWGIYLFKFYSFYHEAYFYVDKRLSLFIQMLSFVNNNWEETFTYFILAFLLMTVTLFLSYFLYLTKKRALIQNKPIFLIFCFNLLCCLALLVNACCFIFLVLLILAGSLIYIIFTLVNLSVDKEQLDYVEGEIIDVKGPFTSEKEAQTAVKAFLGKWQEEKIILGEEVYLDKDSKYYVDFYIEVINK